MAMYEIDRLQGFNAYGFHIERPTPVAQKSVRDGISEDESIIVYKIALTDSQEKVYQVPSENTQ